MSSNASAPLQNQNQNHIQSQATHGQQLPAGQMFLQKKGLLGAAGKRNMGSIVSPTDNVLSPCSAKLSSSKQRHFQKAKPMSLTSQLSKLSSDSTSTVDGQQKSKVDF